MIDKNNRLTLDRPAAYQIKVPGVLDKRWADWVEGMKITIENVYDCQSITTLTGNLDQAALQGLSVWGT